MGDAGATGGGFVGLGGGDFGTGGDFVATSMGGGGDLAVGGGFNTGGGSALGGGMTGSGGGTACSSLSLMSCSTTSSCELHWCFDCACAASAGSYCSDVGQGHTCSGGVCFNKCCRGDADCFLQHCFAPWDTGSCGTCYLPQNPCYSDNECDAGEMCAPVACGCGGAGACAPGCTATSCMAPTSCVGTVHPHCLPVCATSADCTAGFDCVAGGCVQRLCNADDNCDFQTFCVQGLCSPTLGACGAPIQ